MEHTWLSHSEDETGKIAAEIAAILTFPAVVFLNGDLGAGKTSLCRALIRHIVKNPTEIIPSPTYNLVQTYNNDAIWHFDLYRLDHSDQIYDAGWEEALTADLCLIEWPDRLGNLKPDNAVNITITTDNNDARVIAIQS